MFSGFASNITNTLSRGVRQKNEQKKLYEKRINELKSDIEQAKRELQTAMDNFNNVTEPRLIDFYIYKIQSEQTRYEQFLSEYKVLHNLSEPPAEK